MFRLRAQIAGEKIHSNLHKCFRENGCSQLGVLKGKANFQLPTQPAWNVQEEANLLKEAECLGAGEGCWNVCVLHRNSGRDVNLRLPKLIPDTAFKEGESYCGYKTWLLIDIFNIFLAQTIVTCGKGYIFFRRENDWKDPVLSSGKEHLEVFEQQAGGLPHFREGVGMQPVGHTEAHGLGRVQPVGWGVAKMVNTPAIGTNPK